MKKLQTLTLKALVFPCILSICLLNAKVFASKTSIKNNTSLSAMKSQMYSDSESGESGGGRKTCGSVECAKKAVTGMPPYQITSTYYGHYKHCTASNTGNCTDSSCNTECDATIII